MTTLRKELNRAGFDWNTGWIIWHDHRDPNDEWREPNEWGSPAYEERVGKPEIIYPVQPSDHWVLDIEYDDGFGGGGCPRFIAQDEHRIYFPYRYDGATGITAIFKNLKVYLIDGAPETPYPGGG